MTDNRYQAIPPFVRVHALLDFVNDEPQCFQIFPACGSAEQSFKLNSHPTR
jgi:hypothetical protein